MEEKENKEQIKDKDRDPYNLTDDEIEFVCSLDVKSDFYFASILPWLYCFINWYWLRFIIMFVLNSISSEILAETEHFDWLVVAVILWDFIVTRFIVLFWLRNRMLKSWKFDEQLIAYREDDPEKAKIKYSTKQPNIFWVLFVWFVVWLIITFVLDFIRSWTPIRVLNSYK